MPVNFDTEVTEDVQKDRLVRRCPRLGGPVSFQYCMTCEGDENLCFKILDCWFEYFDVVGYLKRILPEDAFNRISEHKPRPKMLSIIELIEKAKKRTGNGG